MKMKSCLLLFIILLSFGFSANALAQGKSKQNGPPPWAPAHGYRAKTRHIYFPQHNFYFDMQKGVYIYLSGGNWITAVKLPSLFGRVNLSQATQIELDFADDHPHKHNRDHQVKYKPKPQGSQVKAKSAGPPPPPPSNNSSKPNGNSGGGGSKEKGKKN